jgi:ZIP family zinc transporter
VSDVQIAILGGIAGLTIFLGLPMGRVRHLSTAARALLNATAAGILLFLFVEVMGHGIEPVEHALTAASDHGGSWLHFSWLALLFVALFGVGALSLVYYEQWLARRGPRDVVHGPGAATVGAISPGLVRALSPTRRLALFIALGIGLHNFSEGLAIGQSAAQDKISLALLLIVGFGLHNATEGFGIVAPMAGEDERPSWGFLAVLGLIGGGPTFLGTLVGQSFVNDTLNMAFLALAGGSILFVVTQLFHVADRIGRKDLLVWGLVIGLVLGFGTDFVLVAAGA